MQSLFETNICILPNNRSIILHCFGVKPPTPESFSFVIFNLTNWVIMFCGHFYCKIIYKRSTLRLHVSL